MNRKSLVEILGDTNGAGNLRNLWTTTETAGERGALPPGEYHADIVAGELEQSRTNRTPGYRLTFVVAEGEFVGRRFWLDCWLTAAAIPATKRDLRKLGIVDVSQLERPLPARFRCRAKLTLRRDDNGNEVNRVQVFEVLGIVEPERDAFAPVDPPTPDQGEGTVEATSF